MPASPVELQQIKLWASALLQLVQAVEARDKAESLLPTNDGAPIPRITRIA